MRSNFVNIHDFHTLKKLGPKAFSMLASRLMLSKRARVKATWTQPSPPTNWEDIPYVKERLNYLISGNSQIDAYEYILQKYCVNREPLNALSLGCGDGNRELALADTGKFNFITAYDLSESRIESAIATANQQGLSNIISYRVADVNSIEIQESYYDVILVEDSLHHFSPLEKVLLKIDRFLKPNGYFVVKEFVGPTRFQWTNKQLQAINNLLFILPDRYKALLNNGVIKSKVFRPSHLRMLLSDPSEAVESSRIEPLLHQIFDVVEVRPYGGTILHPLLSEIAHNFLSNEIEARSWLDICFETEDLLLASGDIKSDFIVAVCIKTRK